MINFVCSLTLIVTVQSEAWGRRAELPRELARVEVNDATSV